MLIADYAWLIDGRLASIHFSKSTQHAARSD